MEDEHLATYAELLKAVRQNKKQSQTRHLASQCSQSMEQASARTTAPTSLFPPCKLKGGHPAVSGRAAMVEDDEDLDVGDDVQEEGSCNTEEVEFLESRAAEPYEEYMV